jgi:hypothetical protein
MALFFLNFSTRFKISKKPQKIKESNTLNCRLIKIVYSTPKGSKVDSKSLKQSLEKSKTCLNQ